MNEQSKKFDTIQIMPNHHRNKCSHLGDALVLRKAVMEKKKG